MRRDLTKYSAGIIASLCLVFTACSKEPQDAALRDDVQSLKPESSDSNVAVEEELSDEELNLIGGVVANPKDFPASVYISASGSRCSATVVGPRTVISAAHCMSNGGQITFSVGANKYSARCSHHPSYRGNSTADWALCKTNLDVIGIEYEAINKETDILKVGKPILLTGYGCTTSGGRGGNDGRYRVGESTMIRVPQSGSNNHDIVSRGQGAALCFGDSGGPAFAYLDDAKTKRVLVGVNSRGDIRTTSYLSSVSQGTAQTWIKSWMEANQTKICGLSDDAPSCRHGGANTQLTQECQQMIVSGALDKLSSCAKEEAPDRVSCLEARDTVSACVESKS